MNLRELQAAVRAGKIDTVIAAAPDVFGRLVGKRFRAPFFLEEVARHGTHGCSYLLTLNIDQDPQDGFQLANWDKGFGDFALKPDLATFRSIPWQEGAALVLCDFHHEEGGLVQEAPRSVLLTQLGSLDRDGMKAVMASELEFFLFNQSYSAAAAAKHEVLPPSSDYRIDYLTTQTARDEPLMRAARNLLPLAGVPIESSKGEWGRGQHEINFRHADALRMADMHTVFKQGMKELAEQHGKSVTFMAKYLAGEAGSSCHIHLSLWRGRTNLFWDAARKRGSKLFRRFLGGLMKYSPELCYFYAPTINSYKRFQAGSWAPTRMAWAADNRTVGFRVVGHGGSFRIENRLPGADANPYLAFAAMLAAGRAGIEEGLDCGEAYVGNAYTDEKLPALPRTLARAAELLGGSKVARKALGDAVTDFYGHTASLEVQAFDSAVTNWERSRYFEQI